jgi:signal transduction histidine kinase
VPEPRASLLIIDDERGPAESLRMVFKEQYEVFTAPGGKEALEVLRDQAIDVVTLDLRMPGMAGNEVMEHIKRLDPDIEIIVVTGYASLDSAIRGLRHRVFDYVTKPFDVPQISDLVERAVARRRATLRARDFRDRFLANLSHELRTPLNAIMGFNGMLTDQLTPQLSQGQKDTFERIQTHSQRLLTLIDTVTVLNQVQDGEYQFIPVEFDVRDVLAWAVQRFAAIAVEQRVTLYARPNDQPVSIVTDRDKLERLVAALVDNALKFTPALGEVSLGASIVDESGTIEIDVCDTGIGVPTEDIVELIEVAPLTVLPKPTVHTGLGLGLRLASELSRLMDGDLSVRRQDPEGSRFCVRLPHESSRRESNAHVQ